MASRQRAFPAGLYGLLLLALCALTVPALGRPIENTLLGAVACWPGRLAGWLQSPVRAAADPATAERLVELGADLVQRMAAADFAGAPPEWLADCTPVVCQVLAVDRPGGGGEPSELHLDRAAGELTEALPFVTKGPALVGFLAAPRSGADPTRAATHSARVQLLHHPSAPAVAGELVGEDGVRLQLVARPARPADPAPLRVELWDDPHRAATVDRKGLAVFTAALPGAVRQPPPGLRIGSTVPWGYERIDGARALATGVWLELPYAPRALATVVVWLPGRARSVPPPRGAVQVEAQLRELPGGRLLTLAAEGAVADGGAVVVDGWCLGRATGHAFGVGRVTPFRHSREPWGLLLLPDDPSLPVVELRGAVVGELDGAVLVRCEPLPKSAAATPWLPPGHLFTGCNGPHCPQGLLLGRAAPVARDPELLQVVVPAAPAVATAAVLMAETPP